MLLELLSSGLYDFEVSEISIDRRQTLLFSPFRFPPRPERLLRLMELLPRLGFSRLIIDWGGLFPWTLDERFQSRLAYTDQVIAEADKAARQHGMENIPRLPVGRNMSCFLAHPTYRHLRLESNNPDVLDPNAPGVRKFIGDLLEDVISLTPEIVGVYFDPEPETPVLTEYAKLLVTTLLPAIGPEIVRLGLCLFMREDAIGVVDPVPESDVMEWVRPVRFPLGYAHPLYFPPTLELALAALAESTGVDVTDLEACELSHSGLLRDGFSSFCEGESICWQLIRSARQILVMSPSLGYCPARIFGEMDGLVRRLHEKLLAIDGLTEELRAGLLPATYHSVVTGWLRSRLEPIREELAVLRSRQRQVEAWMESE